MSKLFQGWKDDSFLSEQGTIIRYDKVEHAVLGFTGMLITQYFFHLSGIQQFFLAWIFWNFIGIVWEIYQYFVHQHRIQVKDIAANNIGFAFSLIFYFYPLWSTL